MVYCLCLLQVNFLQAIETAIIIDSNLAARNSPEYNRKNWFVTFDQKIEALKDFRTSIECYDDANFIYI